MHGERRCSTSPSCSKSSSSVEHDAGAADATPEDQALRQVLNEIDDIARATLGSITIATMRKLVDRRGQWPRAGEAEAAPASARPDLPSIIYLRSCTRDAAKSAA